MCSDVLVDALASIRIGEDIFIDKAFAAKETDTGHNRVAQNKGRYVA
jgi:hypothetical protein